jgi:hypothetical protein
MAKIIRPTYPVEVSIGLLLLIFVVSFIASGQIFSIHLHDDQGNNVYFGMTLASSAVIVMVLVLWEEFIFPIRIKPTDAGMEFRNHRHKLMTQVLIYFIIPAIFVFLYFNYEVNHGRFIVWAAICIIAPVAGKLYSGIKNYNDFLKLTHYTIEYKNNREEGSFEIKNIQYVKLIKDQNDVLHKMQLIFVTNQELVIDLDEMELEEYYHAINHYMTDHYRDRVKIV